MSGNPSVRLHRYRRVSTSDKGQDPRRQEIATDEWAAREGAVIVGDTVDEGTSATFTNPFDRKKFLEACDSAQAAGADGLLAEEPDRVCGQGSDELGWTRFELRRRYKLELFFANQPRALHATLGGNVSSTVSAEVRRERVALDRKRIREGIRNRATKGLPVGGAAQQKVTPELVALVMEVKRSAPNWGLRRIAYEVSARRGAMLASLSERERRKRKVTHESVRAALAVAEVPIHAEPSNGVDRQTEPNAGLETDRQRETSPIDATKRVAGESPDEMDVDGPGVDHHGEDILPSGSGGS